MHIGLYFGSFNPIHNGHLAIAQYMYDMYSFNAIWFVVSPSNPLKEKDSLADEHKRFKWVEMAIDGADYFHASDVEFAMERPSYTYLTLRKLCRDYPQNTYSLILGSDSLDTITLWKNYKKILENHFIYIYPRSKNVKEIKSKNIVYTNPPILDISSTLIRKKVKNNENIQGLAPEKARELIEKEWILK